MKLSISKGNIKLGKIYNISLPPVKSCGKNLPCYATCYAQKAYRMYPGVRKAWNKNFAVYKKDSSDYFKQIDDFLTEKKPTHFRWHVAGDFPDVDYYVRVLGIADKHKDVKFLAFTKRFDMLKQIHALPRENLSIVLSAWFNLRLDKGLRNQYPVAWMDDKKNPDQRIPSTLRGEAIACPSNCQICIKKDMSCWNLRKIGLDVVFLKH